ncbi:MAG TPA: TRZ/ATZ family hydrolase [Usitatibacter sp.]|jgi:5-methylthioadenosine/S-adenosylhomocysteine deaminase|nr:TRZ/ATZ family hydrolase [Usitatibacter sp.]
MQAIDTLICAAHVVPVAPRGVLDNHAVAVDAGRIVALVPRAEAFARFQPRRVVDLDRHLLIPGLVNLHCHAAMALMRGLADDLPLMRWLQEHIWPAEAKHARDEFVHDGSLLAFAELLRGGTTCVNDMYFFPEATARAALRAGIRAALGMIAIEFPSAYATDAADYLQKGLATRDAYLGEPLLSFTLAPHAPYTVGDDMLRRMGVLAEELDIPIHTHVHETPGEIAESVSRHGVRPLERLRRLGVVGPHLIAVHSVHLEEHEIDVMAREGVCVAHCPSSNLKLASGIAPVAAMRARGVRVGIGTDGAASNNRLDMMTEMRTAALLAKVQSGDASAVGAFEALEMATLEGARALGLEGEIGSIEPGKRADLAAVELSSLDTLPSYHPMSDLVYSAGREHVTHVWVDGEPRLEDNRLVGLDTEDLRDRARWWQEKLRK